MRIDDEPVPRLHQHKWAPGPMLARGARSDKEQLVVILVCECGGMLVRPIDVNVEDKVQ